MSFASNGNPCRYLINKKNNNKRLDLNHLNEIKIIGFDQVNIVPSYCLIPR